MIRFDRLCAMSLLLASLTLAGLSQATQVRAAEADKLITLDAEDAYLPSVLKILAEKGDLNIVTGPGVTTGRLSIHMRDVPIDQAVNLVVRAAGLAYERIGNSVLVASPEALKQETGLSSYVVDLKYADAVEVKDALVKLAAEIQVDRGGNRLIVVTSPRVIAEIQAIVKRLDVPARQVMLEARIIEVSTNQTQKLGIDWDLLNRQSFIILEGDATPAAPGALPATMPFIGKLNQSGRLTVQARTFQAALDMLVHDGNARILANPKVATLNGKEASILVGQRIPYVVSGGTFSSTGGGIQTQSVQKEEVGIKLRITPLINADGYITTSINPEVSSVTAFVGPSGDLPVVDTRQASTTVRLKDGNSVIIGGLLSEDKTRTVAKLPILGQIPGLGLLFQHHSVTSAKKDLVIEITPRIIPDQQ